MPCNDVTELIRVTLDAGERLESYDLAKRTCGRSAGARSLLLDHLRGRSVNELLGYEADTFLVEHPPADDLEEFLMLKHLFAVQSVLEVYTGRQAGGPKDACAAAEITYGDGETVICARIAIDLVTERIEACGHCKGCGSKKKAKVIFN